MFNTEKSSFRDPSGYIFFYKGEVYRNINNFYKSEYELLIESGLYAKLKEKKLLIEHNEINRAEIDIPVNENCFKIIKPRALPFISYPYCWSFSQLKDAALATLRIQKISIEHGMSLKDASAYNIQFIDGAPVFIDTLSFEKYNEKKPWIAYGQFCRHFLAPVALMAYTDIRLNQLLKNYIDGIPLDLAAKLLPFKSNFNSGILLHLKLHSKVQTKYADTKAENKTGGRAFGRTAMLSLIDNLESCIKKLRLPAKLETEWKNYSTADSYSDTGGQDKKNFIMECLDTLAPAPSIVWDIGANKGDYSRLAARKNIYTVAFDIDTMCVELNYRKTKKEKEKNILPLIMDLTNPSPSIGWANEERKSLTDRGQADLVMALALIHHLAISNNIPIINIINFFAAIAKNLIIEFVPKSDRQTQRLLANRADIFTNYNELHFEECVKTRFQIIKKHQVTDSERTLYFLKKTN